MTLGNSLETLDLLRSSARVLSPGEGDDNSGLGKGSAIPSFTLMASDRAVTSGFLIQTEVWPAVRPYDPGHRRLALDDVVPQLESGPLREPLELDNMLLDTPVSVVLAGMLSRLCLTAGQSACRTLGLYVVRICVLLKPVRTPVAIFGSLGVCIYVPASRHWLISYSPIHLT